VNEEETKIKLIIPWLRSRGVSLTDLSFERSFRLHIGHHTVDFKPDRASDAVSARLDILVTRHGRNLLLVEVKRFDLELNDSDREQAISYARLVHPIAPLTLVTNGREYWLFDTITKEKLDENTPVREDLIVSLPTADREEAITIFLGLSPTNLLAFCKSQTEDELRPLVGSPTELSKIYIPQLHVRRRGLHTQIRSFLHGMQPGCVILGESGSGKTCSMCHLITEMLAEGYPVLFFRGVSLEGRLLDRVAEEFEWTFGDDQSAIALIKRLDKFAPQDLPVIIAVDAVEEWRYPDRVSNVCGILRHLRGRQCKLLLTCKTNSWEGFLYSRGNPTGVAEDLFTTASNGDERRRSYLLPPLSEEEFYWAVRNYRDVFDFHGVIDTHAIVEGKRSPYLLRVFFQTARDLKLPNLTLTYRQFLDRYYDLLLAKTSNPEVAHATLRGIAEILYQKNSPLVSRDLLRQRLELGINENVMPELFEQNLLVLEQSHDAATGPKVGFYSEPLRNYLIAFRVLNWPAVDAQTFSELTRAAVDVQTEAVAYYLPQATAEQQRAVAPHVYDVVERYLHAYRDAIEVHFPRLRSFFEPKTNGRIGIAGELMIETSRLGYFGFRPLDAGDPEVLFLAVKNLAGPPDLLYANGVDKAQMISSSNGIAAIDVDQTVAKRELFPQLLRIVEQGELDESSAPELSRELLQAIVAGNPQMFPDCLDPRTQRPSYPIRLGDIENGLQRASLREHFTHLCLEDHRRHGRVQETRNGRFLSFSWQPSNEDQRLIDAQVNECLRMNTSPGYLFTNVNLQRLVERARRAIEGLGGIDATLNAAAFGTRSGFHLDFACDRLRMNPDELAESFAFFYETYLETYKQVIEANFPTLKHRFALYSKLPLHVLVSVMHSPAWDWRAYPVTVIGCAKKGGIESDVGVMKQADLTYDNGRPLLKGEPLDYVLFNSSMYLSSEVRGYPHFCPELQHTAQPLNLRSKVYKTIKSELTKLLAIASVIADLVIAQEDGGNPGVA
jgi:hypothetical protein